MSRTVDGSPKNSDAQIAGLKAANSRKIIVLLHKFSQTLPDVGNSPDKWPMLAKDWIRAAQNAGWNVASVRGSEITISCAAHGCHGSRTYRLDTLDGPPPACPADHVAGYGAPAYDSYKALVDELRRRRVEIGLDQIDLGEVMGIPDGYVSKLESFARSASSPMVLMWAQALGLEITFRTRALPPATIKAIQDRQAAPYQHNQARVKHGR